MLIYVFKTLRKYTHMLAPKGLLKKLYEEVGGINGFSNIYIITNKVNGKQYIGQTISPSVRFQHHIRDARNSKKNHRLLARAICKYGAESFEYKIVEENIPLNEVHQRERWWIETKHTKKPNGYNLTDGGEGTFGYSHTEEAKQKMSKSAKGRKLKVPRSEEYRKAISERQKGRFLSEETKRKISEAHTGKTISEETKQKIQFTQKNRGLTEKHKEKIRQARQNMSKEQKDMICKKAVATKKENGVDFGKHFREMDENRKKEMYETISKSNKRRRPVRCLDVNTNVIREFHSAGSAGKWIVEMRGNGKNAKKGIISSIKRNGTAFGYRWEYIVSQTTIPQGSTVEDELPSEAQNTRLSRVMI